MPCPSHQQATKSTSRASQNKPVSQEGLCTRNERKEERDFPPGELVMPGSAAFIAREVVFRSWFTGGQRANAAGPGARPLVRPPFGIPQIPLWNSRFHQEGSRWLPCREPGRVREVLRLEPPVLGTAASWQCHARLAHKLISLRGTVAFVGISRGTRGNKRELQTETRRAGRETMERGLPL